MEDDQLIILIKKYLDGTATPEETDKVEQWYELQKDNTSLFYKGDPERIKESSDRSLQNVLHKIAQQTSLAYTPVVLQTAPRYFPRWMAAAASVLIFSIAGFFAYKNMQGRSTVKYQEITAANGQVIHVTLSDHTSIWLNACSKLKYPLAMTNQNREVYLEGEAYFDVKHDPSKPFLVHTPGLTTAVLGTAFSVTAYPHKTTQSVIVIRGKVQVSHQKTILGLLTPNRRVDYDTANGKSHLSSVNAASAMSWKDGKLQFENQDMLEITARLNRWYGYSFKFNSLKFKDQAYTASFDNKTPLDRLLEVMKAISKVSYKIDNTSKTVTFLGTGSTQ